MIELYVLVTLGAIGYMLNNSSKSKQFQKISQFQNVKIPKSEIPSSNTVYDSSFYEKSKSLSDSRAAKLHAMAQSPIQTGVIDKNYGFDKGSKDQKIKSMSGNYIDASDFKHNNMIPYFGAKIRTNLDEGLNESLLETYTGVPTSNYKKKCEVQSFFDPTKDLGNVNGMGNNTDYMRERIVTSRLRTNETPVEKMYVGPGINKGYESKPTGGFQQLDMQDAVMPKCVDQLRAINKPKLTFEGRIVDGTKEKMRGDMGIMRKNRVETFYEQGSERYMTTTGAYLKPSEIPEFNVKGTHRMDTNTEYIGHAIKAQGKARTVDSDVRQTSKSQMGEFGLRNALLSLFGKGDKYDFGKSNIQVYANERDITSTKVYQGNVISLIKALVAPIQDIVKDTKKDELADNPRHFGNMSIQIPDKPTMYDPNDVARTTIKETLIHDEMGTGTITGAKQLAVYDPDEVAKKTIRETLERMDYEMNLKGGKHAATVYDPNDKTRTTHKETLVDKVRDGNLDRVEGMGDYKTTKFDPKNTQKQFISDKDYIGIANRENGDGYLSTEYDAKNTQKQFLADVEYYGGAEAIADKKQMSYDDIYNAYISAKHEQLIVGREPTQSGKKEYVGGECVNLAHKKQECANVAERYTQNKDKIQNSHVQIEEDNLTRMKKSYEQNDRLDPALLKAYLDNPYTKPLTSYA
jgi:hypothetical protein